VADTLNWIDQYLRAALGMKFPVTQRWSGDRICHGLPSFSVKS
jgi:hypothetical protein